MQFLDDSLHPENQDKVVITVAPYGPEWMPEDFPEDIPVTMDEQIQKAVDCYNAGATVLHLHVRELDGKGSKRIASDLSISVKTVDVHRASIKDKLGAASIAMLVRDVMAVWDQEAAASSTNA